MKRKPIFFCELNISEESRKSLLKVFQNHLVIYNYFLDITYKNINLNYKEKKNLIKEFIDNNKIYPYIINAVFNEIYYQEKKVRRNIFKEKILTEIQYLTITDNTLIYDPVTRKCFIKYTDIEFYLNKDLNEEIFLRRKYVNISYSVNKDKFEFKIFD